MGDWNDGATPFNNSLATLERIHLLQVKAQECIIENRISSYKKVLLEIFKETAPFLCDKEVHMYTNRILGKHAKDDCLLLIARKKWKVIDEIQIKTDSYGRVLEYEEKTLALLVDFDFWLKNALKQKGINYAKGFDASTALFR